MASLIQYATSDASIRGTGVFILEVPPPGTLRGVGQGVVGLVGEFPWGPSTAYEPESSQDLINSMFGPCGLGHAAFASVYGKKFGRVVCARVIGSDAVAASVTIEDAATAGAASLKVTANHAGTAGNAISIVIATASGKANATVSFTKADGSTYTATYVAVQAADGTVTDPGDPYVTFSKATSATNDAFAGSYTLGQSVADPINASVSGTNGTINAAAYAAAIALLGGASSAVSVICPVEPSSAITDADINGSLYTASASNIDKLYLLKTVNGETTANAIINADLYARDNVVKCWPRVNQRLPNSDGNLVVTEVDGNAFLASILVNTDPWLSPGGTTGSPFTGEIVSLENETISNDAYANLTEGGVSAWFMSSRNGAIIRGAVSTSLDTTVNRIRRRRYTTFLAESISAFLEAYVDLPLDLDLAGRKVGPNTGAQLAAIRGFLSDEKNAAHIIAFSVDAFEAMTSAKFAAGRWDITVRVQDVPGAEQIVLRLQAGPSVSV